MVNGMSRLLDDPLKPNALPSIEVVVSINKVQKSGRRGSVLGFRSTVRLNLRWSNAVNVMHTYMYQSLDRLACADEKVVCYKVQQEKRFLSFREGWYLIHSVTLLDGVIFCGGDRLVG